ncbi:GAS8-like protein, putative [Plasmodium malariae]|uniref:GAS8-like protein, putative n=1 Tax=Plasmodium malariae TaxID=5858 RepID=A0A1D3SMR9_PLAMA|nr:GAS8-like protein, putative [Plasmodium malariae]SCO93136.1 GAS8-like protein, putative [Plasmodium malariae]
MKKGTKKISSKKKAEKEILVKELKKLNGSIAEEQKNVEDLNSKFKSIEGSIFLGYHEIKILKLDLKNKEIELEENKSHNLLSSRKIDNIINRYVLKCYETFLNNLTKNEIELHTYARNSEEEKKRHQTNKDYNKLATFTNIQHLNNLNSIVLSKNQILDEINRKFTRSLKKLRENYTQKISLEREKLDRKRQKIIFNLQKKKNETIKNILTEHNEKVLNIQSYFTVILDDQLEIIQKLEDEKLNKKKIFLSKRKNLEELKKSIEVHRKKLEMLNKDVMLLEKNTTDYEKLKNDLKRIKEKRKKQQKVLTELKLEADIKKMLLSKISAEYENVYNQNAMRLYEHLQGLLLENYFLETKIKLKNETLEINNLELSKWKESVDPEQNEILNNALRLKFQKFEILKKEIEDLMDTNEKNRENYEAIMHLNYYSNEDLDVLKRENAS